MFQSTAVIQIKCLCPDLVIRVTKTVLFTNSCIHFFFSPGEGETECQKSPGGQVNNNNNTHFNSEASNYTHIHASSHPLNHWATYRYCSIICHIHNNDHGWSAALPLLWHPMNHPDNKELHCRCSRETVHRRKKYSLHVCPISSNAW